MSSVAEITAAIQRLSPDEKRNLRNWFLKEKPAEDNDDILVPANYRQKVLDAIDNT